MNKEEELSHLQWLRYVYKDKKGYEKFQEWMKKIWIGPSAKSMVENMQKPGTIENRLLT